MGNSQSASSMHSETFPADSTAFPSAPTDQHLSNSAANYGDLHGDAADDGYSASALGFDVDNPSNVDPRTGSVLPSVNPLARVPHTVRSGQVAQVMHNQSHDVRGDLNHVVGYKVPQSNANPRALGAVQDRQNIARIAKLGSSSNQQAMPYGRHLHNIPIVDDDAFEEEDNNDVAHAHRFANDRLYSAFFADQ